MHMGGCRFPESPAFLPSVTRLGPCQPAHSGRARTGTPSPSTSSAQECAKGKVIPQIPGRQVLNPSPNGPEEECRAWDGMTVSRACPEAQTHIVRLDSSHTGSACS